MVVQCPSLLSNPLAADMHHMNFCKETSINCSVPGIVSLDLSHLFVKDAVMILYITIYLIS